MKRPEHPQLARFVIHRVIKGANPEERLHAIIFSPESRKVLKEWGYIPGSEKLPNVDDILKTGDLEEIKGLIERIDADRRRVVDHVNSSKFKQGPTINLEEDGEVRSNIARHSSYMEMFLFNIKNRIGELEKGGKSRKGEKKKGRKPPRMSKDMDPEEYESFMRAWRLNNPEK